MCDLEARRSETPLLVRALPRDLDGRLVRVEAHYPGPRVVFRYQRWRDSAPAAYVGDVGTGRQPLLRWSTRIAASMNDVDTDDRRYTMAVEERP